MKFFQNNYLVLAFLIATLVGLLCRYDWWALLFFSIAYLVRGPRK